MKLEDAEKVASKPWFLILFNVGLVGLWATFGVDVSNIFISIITAEIVLLTLGATRRSNIAMHAKLDELIDSQTGARNDIEHIEDRQEEEIMERRK